MEKVLAVIGVMLIVLGALLGVFGSTVMAAWAIYELVLMISAGAVTFWGILWALVLWVFRGIVGIIIAFILMFAGAMILPDGISDRIEKARKKRRNK